MRLGLIGFAGSTSRLIQAISVLAKGATGLFLAMSLSACSILPGMYAHFERQPEILQSPEEPANLDYTLLQVTPMLVRELNEQVATRDAAMRGDLPAGVRPSYPYRLGPQDTLRIFVWGHPDLTPVNMTATANTMGATPAGRVIDSQGYLFFPMVGRIRAAGMTVNQFREELSKRLSKFINDPQVEVDVAAFRSQRVFVAGAVKQPGILPITDQPMHVTDAIGQVGGALETADLYEVVLTRKDHTVRLNLDRLYYDGDLTANVMLADGDVLSVPDRLSRKIYMLGEVGNTIGSNLARAYVMRRGRMTLAEVLADAGGVSPFSSAANEIYVMRADPNAMSVSEAIRKPLIYRLDAARPEALVMADQFPIQPRDLIFVNPTGPTMIGRFLGQFLPIFATVNTAGSNTPF
jgi:polysaccharide export outer membrane protein